jgi:hypothetical protein
MPISAGREQARLFGIANGCRWCARPGDDHAVRTNRAAWAAPRSRRASSTCAA